MFKAISLISLLISVLISILYACSDHQQKECDLKAEGRKVSMNYASLFSVYDNENQYFLTINKSWDTKEQKHYLFATNVESKNCYNSLTIPCKRVIVFSATHLYMIDTLKETNSIIGISNKNYTASKKIHERITSGHIKELGDFENCDVEKIISLSPDLIIVSGTGKDHTKIEQLEKAGITVIENVEWMENHPLGRAEWIKVFGLIFNKFELADKIYNGIQKNYQRLKSKAEKLNPGPEIIYSRSYGSTWYIPGQNSFIGQILKDAKLPYPWDENSSAGSISYDLEIIVEKQINDSIWISPESSSLTELREADSRHELFEAYKKGLVFHYDRKKGVNGMTEYWEKSVLRCDWILSDFINITRKGQYTDSLYFFRKLEP